MLVLCIVSIVVPVHCATLTQSAHDDGMPVLLNSGMEPSPKMNPQHRFLYATLAYRNSDMEPPLVDISNHNEPAAPIRSNVPLEAAQLTEIANANPLVEQLEIRLAQRVMQGEAGWTERALRIAGLEIDAFISINSEWQLREEPSDLDDSQMWVLVQVPSAQRDLCRTVSSIQFPAQCPEKIDVSVGMGNLASAETQMMGAFAVWIESSKVSNNIAPFLSIWVQNWNGHFGDSLFMEGADKLCRKRNISLDLHGCFFLPTTSCGFSSISQVERLASHPDFVRQRWYAGVVHNFTLHDPADLPSNENETLSKLNMSFLDPQIMASIKKRLSLLDPQVMSSMTQRLLTKSPDDSQQTPPREMMFTYLYYRPTSAVRREVQRTIQTWLVKNPAWVKKGRSEMCVGMHVRHSDWLYAPFLDPQHGFGRTLKEYVTEAADLSGFAKPNIFLLTDDQDMLLEAPTLKNEANIFWVDQGRNLSSTSKHEPTSFGKGGSSEMLSFYVAIRIMAQCDSFLGNFDSGFTRHIFWSVCFQRQAMGFSPSCPKVVTLGAGMGVPVLPGCPAMRYPRKVEWAPGANPNLTDTDRKVMKEEAEAKWKNEQKVIDEEAQKQKEQLAIDGAKSLLRREALYGPSR